MFRVVRLAGTYYAKSIDGLTEDEAVYEISIFVSESTPVIIVEDLEDLEDFNIEIGDIEIVGSK